MYYHGSARRYLWRNSDRKGWPIGEVQEVCLLASDPLGNPPKKGRVFIELDSGEILSVPAEDVTKVER